MLTGEIPLHDVPGLVSIDDGGTRYEAVDHPMLREVSNWSDWSS